MGTGFIAATFRLLPIPSSLPGARVRSHQTLGRQIRCHPANLQATGLAAERSTSGLGPGFWFLTGAAPGWWDWWMIMGASGSKLEKALVDQFPEGECYFGLENFGNTYYCDSFLLALYFCIPFREQLLEYYSSNKNPGDIEENPLTFLADLSMQDAHEF